MEPIVAEGHPNKLYESQFRRVHGYHASYDGYVRFSDGRVLESAHTGLVAVRLEVPVNVGILVRWDNWAKYSRDMRTTFPEVLETIYFDTKDYYNTIHHHIATAGDSCVHIGHA
jgi:hypothetical protein